jgi:hypothetical protein
MKYSCAITIKAILFSSLYLLMMSAAAQKLNQRGIDPKNQKEMLVGACNLQGLKTTPFDEWFNKEYAEYKLDTSSLDQVKPLMKGVSVVLVMATWCSDSRREVPRFYKMLDYLHVKTKKMQVFCVDREKKAGDSPVANYKATYVPTFIIFKKDKELGRIIESPAESLEKDLLKILSAN